MEKFCQFVDYNNGASVCKLSVAPGQLYCAGHGRLLAPPTSTAVDDGFKELHRILLEAASDAAGKGRERHSKTGEPWDQQQIIKFGEWLGSNHGQIFQACKKAIESARLPKDKAINELRGAMVYLAAAIKILENG